MERNCTEIPQKEEKLFPPIKLPRNTETTIAVVQGFKLRLKPAAELDSVVYVIMVLQA